MIERLFGAVPPAALPAGQPAPDGRSRPRYDLPVDEATVDVLRRQLQPGARPALAAIGTPEPGPLVALVDPSGEAAHDLLHAVAGLHGRPLQQLHLRDRPTLRTLGVLNGASVWRPGQGELLALACRFREPAGLAHRFMQTLVTQADLAVVLASHLSPPAAAALRLQLLALARQADWRCPALVLVLPAHRLDLQSDWLKANWPAKLSLRVMVDGGDPPERLWQQLLACWPADARRPMPRPPAPPQPNPDANGPAAENLQAQQRLLASLAVQDGVLACALVDLDQGRPLIHQHAPGLDAAAQRLDAAHLAALAQALCCARSAHHAVLGEPPLPDEVLITAGNRQALLRRLPGPRPWAFMAVAERQRLNLALLRFSLIDLERHAG